MAACLNLSGHVTVWRVAQQETRGRYTVQDEFPALNRGYNSVFKPGQLSIGLVVPIERYVQSAVPSMSLHAGRAQLADSLGFAALWLRDVPFNVASFGDAGQTFDPFVYLGYLAASTQQIALGVSSIILPLRHPAHVAKAAASADVLSGGRLLLGIASGDRPDEYPAMNASFDDRGQRFRDSYDYMRQLATAAPVFENSFGRMDSRMDMLPKPDAGTLPMLITGGSQQSPQWVAENGDGWMTYPRSADVQARLIDDWRQRSHTAGIPVRPVMQPLYIDLVAQADAAATPIHLGFRSGVNALRDYLLSLRQIGVNHCALNLRFNKADIDVTLQRLAEELLPDFHTTA